MKRERANPSDPRRRTDRITTGWLSPVFGEDEAGDTEADEGFVTVVFFVAEVSEPFPECVTVFCSSGFSGVSSVSGRGCT